MCRGVEGGVDSVSCGARAGQDKDRILTLNSVYVQNLRAALAEVSSVGDRVGRWAHVLSSSLVNPHPTPTAVERQFVKANCSAFALTKHTC